jgi:protoporphyrinogen oxidase
MPRPRIVILGGGPAGVGAARELARRGVAEAVLLEARDDFGGNAGSFDACGQRLDYGSHRLHPACDPKILADLRELLGDDLLDRPRHGRIRLLGKWIHFPLKPVDLFLRLDKAFALGSMRDLGAKHLPGARSGGDSFASELQANLGRTICEHFYFPYAVKIWGAAPEALSSIQAKKRVSAGTFAKLAHKVLGAVPGFKKPGAGRFFYPRRGYGEISAALAAAARREGATLATGATVARLERPADEVSRWRVHYSIAGRPERIDGDFVWSTLPLSLVARMIEPAAPEAVLRAAGEIEYRSMILVYLHLPVARFSEYDAHYFPGAETRITRLSEPKNYSALGEPAGSTVLCAELPCSTADAWWGESDEELGHVVAQDLATAGIPLPCKPATVFTRRLRHAYPIYLKGYEQPFGVLERWLESLPRFLSYGRQGLFTHDNTHHALAMAYAAVDCLRDGRFDRELWAKHREVFATHVVED